jgi:hypothetical protein
MRADTAMPSNVMLFPRAVDPEAGPAIKSFGDFESAGDLGTAYAPFVPGAGAGLQQDLTLNLPQTRLEDRRTLLTTLDSWKRLADADAGVGGTFALQRQAFDALLSGVSDAFDFSKEDPRTIARYDTLPLANPDRQADVARAAIVRARLRLCDDHDQFCLGHACRHQQRADDRRHGLRRRPV